MGRAVAFGSIDAIDWQHRLDTERDHHLWRMKLCQLEILHSLLASGRAQDQATASALLDSFDRDGGFGGGDLFATRWSPYGASHRMLAMLSGLALADAGQGIDPALRRRVTAFVRRDAAFVRANVEHDLRNNHTERNLAALCLYGMACGGYDRVATARLDGEIDRIVERTILPDGMQIERSAMYQGLSVMALRIFAAAGFLTPGTQRKAVSRAVAAAGAWRMLTHPDGAIALFNDSWIGEVPPTAAVLGPARVADVPVALPDAGYYRIAGGPCTAWFDCGGIGPDWNPGHGHADFLAVEVDLGAHRLIVDPGTSRYSTGDRRTHERSAAAHNGPRFEGVEPVDYLGCFKVGRLAAARAVQFPAAAGVPRDAVAGLLDTAAGTVGRVVTPDGAGGLLIVDAWSTAAHPGGTRLLVPACWTLRHDGARLILTRGDAVAEIGMLAGTLRIGGGDAWCRRYMAPEPAHVIDIVPDPAASGQVAAFRIGPPGEGWPDITALADTLLAMVGGRP
jgi:hypothetical protein